MKAGASGMQLVYLSKEQYKNANEQDFLRELRQRFGDFYLLPEGGNNSLGILGCKDIVDPVWRYNYILCAVGTGATYCGLVLAAGEQKVVGINVLKGDNQIVNTVNSTLSDLGSHLKINGNSALNDPLIQRHCIVDMYAFKGYAAYEPLLVEFKKKFEKATGIPLDYVYTNKLFYGAVDLLNKGKLGTGPVLLVHSGGLQGNPAFEARYGLKP